VNTDQYRAEPGSCRKRMNNYATKNMWTEPRPQEAVREVYVKTFSITLPPKSVNFSLRE